MSEQEFSDFVVAKDLKGQSMKMYFTNFRKFEDMNNNILTANQKVIIDYIKNAKKTDGSNPAPNTLLSMNSFAISFRRHYEKPVNKLLKQREELEDENKKRKTIINKDKLSNLPTLEEIKAHENKLFRDGDWLGFIIVHVLRMVNVRIKDLNILILKPGHKFSGGAMKNQDDKNNYFFVRKNGEVMYVRNNYKTVDKYGMKQNLLTAKKLRQAVANFIDNTGLELSKDKPIYLFSKSNNKNEQLDETSLNRIIQSKTLNNLGENQYNNIIVTEAMKNKNYKKLKQIEQNRGTDMSTLMEQYGLEFPQS